MNEEINYKKEYEELLKAYAQATNQNTELTLNTLRSIRDYYETIYQHPFAGGGRILTTIDKLGELIIHIESGRSIQYG